MKLRHKTAYSGDLFEGDEGVFAAGCPTMRVIDKHGEVRTFQWEVLEPVSVEEEWETVSEDDVFSFIGGRLNFFMSRQRKWVTYPHPDLRFHEINGVTVLQRRKQ
jgi:hypothetical protein